MSDLTNCPNCGKLMAKSKFRDICQDCYKEEEKQYDIVYKYMRKRENRAATLRQIVEATEVKEELILRFIKSGRIHVANFPNLGYPCDKCGRIIRTGKLCEKCTVKLRKDLTEFQNEEKRKEELREIDRRKTYLTNGIKNKN